MNEKINYLTPDICIKEHDKLIKKIGGRYGIMDLGILDSLLDHIKNDIYYPSFESKVSRLVFSIAKFHVFMDGNKRTSIAIGALFLNINDYGYCSDTFIDEMENIVLMVVQNIISEDLLLEIITSIIENDEISYEVKLKISRINI
ncbi:type II toxin-antitoxin system death-on-curing family toxin [Peptostreptococcus faecalis]|uniref:type II toxin-antitoxin system death-on-curing family toxin n=1 Tax=Peptostreptococcus faecalis TaxID=2045015 RepID=UPI000C7A17F4|nr:type II toxin-antitoxin system death-on-curing family toxin [Peptostreptococcus faecalis]